MYQAKKQDNQSSIKFRSLIGSRRRRDGLTKVDSSLNHETLFKAKIANLSQKIDHLSEKTDIVFNRPKEKPALSSSVFVWIIVIALISSSIVFVYFKNQQEILKKNIDLQASHQKKLFQKMIVSHSQKLNHKFSTLQDDFVKQKGFTIDKIHKMDKQLDRQFDRLNQFTNRLSHCEVNLSHLSRAYALHQIKMENLWNTKEKYYSENMKKTDKDIDPTISYWEKKSKTLEQRRAKNVLDHYQKNMYNSKDVQTINPNKSDKNKVYASAYAKIAWRESQSGNIQHAISAYRKAITYNPSLSIAYYNLACLFAKTEKEDQAIFWLKQGRPYFSKKLLKVAMLDQDFKKLRKNPYFLFLMNL